MQYRGRARTHDFLHFGQFRKDSAECLAGRVSRRIAAARSTVLRRSLVRLALRRPGQTPRKDLVNRSLRQWTGERVEAVNKARNWGSAAQRRGQYPGVYSPTLQRPTTRVPRLRRDKQVMNAGNRRGTRRDASAPIQSSSGSIPDGTLALAVGVRRPRPVLSPSMRRIRFRATHDVASLEKGMSLNRPFRFSPIQFRKLAPS